MYVNDNLLKTGETMLKKKNTWNSCEFTLWPTETRKENFTTHETACELKVQLLTLPYQSLVMWLTSMHPLQGVEEADQQIHEHSQVEGDVAPHRHVPGAPVKHRLGWRGDQNQQSNLHFPSLCVGLRCQRFQESNEKLAVKLFCKQRKQLENLNKMV